VGRQGEEDREARAWEGLLLPRGLMGEMKVDSGCLQQPWRRAVQVISALAEARTVIVSAHSTDYRN
jgi:hypothetical protein